MKKSWIPINTVFILEFATTLWWWWGGMFPESAEITAFFNQGVCGILRNHLVQIISLRVRHVSVFNGYVKEEAATCRRHNAQLSSRALASTCFVLTTKRKRCVRLSQDGKRLWTRIPLWHQEDPLFKHAQIWLPVRGLLGNWYFCIHLFHFFMLLSFSFSYLIPTPPPIYIYIYILNKTDYICVSEASEHPDSWK